MTLIDRLREVVAQEPARAAIHLQHAGKADRAITRQDLWNGALRYAGVYRSRGLRPGDVVVLILRHGEDLVFAFWGAIARGVIPSIMPFLTEKLSPEQYRHDLRALIGVTRPRAIVTYPEFEADVRIALDGEVGVLLILTADVVGETGIQRADTEDRGRGLGDIALLQHSSGTTGLQKGVALSHRAVINQVNAYAGALGVSSEDVVVSWLPLYHDMGLIAGFVLPIMAGIPLVLSSPFDWVRAPWRLLRAVSDYRGTLTWLPNFAYNFMAEKIRDRDVAGVDLSSWRAVINCSEPVRLESHRAFFERFEKLRLRWASLQTCYAMAENVFAVTQSTLGREPAIEEVDRPEFSAGNLVPPQAASRLMQVLSSGRTLANTEIKIMDALGASLPERRIGEVALRSDCMLTGYYRRPDADAVAFSDGWYLTGDFGFASGGELFVVGRKKDLIIVGGKNVHPQDLEALSYEVPGVHPGRSVAFGIFNESAGTEEVYLVVEADSEHPASHGELAEHVRQHITRSSAVALRHVRVVGPKWIVKTSSGKTARSANREKYLREMGADPSRQETPLR